MSQSTYKVMFLDENGRAVSTQHVRADSYEQAQTKAIPPKEPFKNVQVRKKEPRPFV